MVKGVTIIGQEKRQFPDCPATPFFGSGVITGDYKMEIWKDVVGFEGKYKISSEGRVKSLDYKHTGEERIMNPHPNSCGYLQVSFYKDNKMYTKKVHRLVAEAFIPNPLCLATVNHKNEIKTDNNVDNLEWMSDYDNRMYGTRLARISIKIKGKFINRKDQSKAVQQFTKDGKFVAEFPSGKEVERQLGFDQGNISNCCLGKTKHSYGYVWRYKE